MNGPPTYHGYTTGESIISFLEDFDLYAATKEYDDARQRIVLEAALKGPARALFRQRIADGTIAVGANAAAHLTNCRLWLRQQFYTEDICQGLKDQLLGLYQGLNESPQAFYTKIQHLINLAQYADAVKDQVAKTAFMNGLHQELVIQIRSIPMVLNLAQKVEYANRYWTTWNPMMNTLQQTLAPHLKNNLNIAPITTPADITGPTANSTIQNPATWRLAQF